MSDAFEWSIPRIKAPPVPNLRAKLAPRFSVGGGGSPSSPSAPAPTSRAAISTPLPPDVEPGADGSVVIRTPGILITLRPDDHPQGVSYQGLTDPGPRWLLPGYRQANGRVTSIGPAQVTLTIQTHYGPGVGPESTSAYGRGTTSQDAVAGTTSLGFHEGWHGTTMIDYVRSHPLPAFQGRVGMTVERFEAARTRYAADLTSYFENMKQDSIQKVDCVGTPAPPPLCPVPNTSTPPGTGKE